MGVSAPRAATAVLWHFPGLGAYVDDGGLCAGSSTVAHIGRQTAFHRPFIAARYTPPGN